MATGMRSSSPLQLRSFQKKALDVLATRHPLVTVIAPTGAGKGVILSEWVKRTSKVREKTLLVLPLLSLGRDTVRRLGLAEVPCAFGMGGQSRILNNEDLVWIVSPELFSFEHFRAKLNAWNPDHLIVDECHCVLDWGQKFRTSYLEVPKWFREHKPIQSLWMTATLPKYHWNHLSESWFKSLPKKPAVIGHFEWNSNLQVRVEYVPWVFRLMRLLGILRNEAGPGIIFCGSRKASEKICAFLSKHGLQTLNYHAGMSVEERLSLERQIRVQPKSHLVTTSAFGMGMDIPHFEWSLIWQPPQNLLTLIQQWGRVGRSGKSANVYLLWEESDLTYWGWTDQTKDDRQQMAKFIKQQTWEERLKILQNFFL